MKALSQTSIDLGSFVDTSAPSTTIYIQGFGPAATDDVRRIASALLPLPPEGDGFQALALLLKQEQGDINTTTKLHARAGDLPTDWPTPDLAILLVDSATLSNQATIRRSMARLSPECLCMVLCCSNGDRDSLHTTFSVDTPVQLALFTVKSTDPLARVWLSWGLINSLYRNIICVDLGDLLYVLPGKGVVYWRRKVERDEITSTPELNSGLSLSDCVTGVFYGRIGGEDVSLEAFTRDAEADLEIWRERGSPYSLVLSFLIDPHRTRGHGVFLFFSVRRQIPCE